MFAIKSDEKSGLENAIDKLLSEMENESADSDEYVTMVDQLVKLYALRDQPQRINLDTLVTVVANLIGIIWIVRYEKEHVLTSKALQFVLKGK